MNIPIVAGRPLTGDDRFGGDPVVLVNEAWARKFLPVSIPCASAFRRARSAGASTANTCRRTRRLSASVRDVSYASLTAPAEPIVYVAVSQVVRPRQTLIITTADGQPERLDSSDPLGTHGD